MTYEIQFWRLKTFNQKLNAVIGFLRHEWKPLLRSLLFIAGPPFVLGVALLVYYITILLQVAFYNLPDNQLLYSLIYFFVGNFIYALSLLTITVITFEIMRMKQQNEDTSQVKLVFRRVRKKILKLIGLTLLLSVLFGLFLLLSSIISSTFLFMGSVGAILNLLLMSFLLLSFFSFIYLVIPITYYENMSIGNSVSKAVTFLKTSYWNTIGMFIGSLLIRLVVLSGIFVPILSLFFYYAIEYNIMTRDDYQEKKWFIIFLSLLYFIYYCVDILSNIFQVVSAGVQYHAVKEKVEQNHVFNQIEHFNEIAE